MRSVEENAKLLCDFGLSSTQAKVYVAIAHLGLAQVGEISKLSSVRREDVYRALPKLEKMGFIEKTLEKPVRIKAIPLEEVFQLLLKRRQDEATQKMSELTTKVDLFLKEFNTHKLKAHVEEDTPQFSLISERDALLGKIASLLKNSERQIDIITSRKKLGQFLFMFSPLFKKAIKQGITIRVIAERPVGDDELIKTIKEQISEKGTEGAIDLRYVDGLPSHYVISDTKEVLVNTSTELGLTESPSLWASNSSLVGLMQRNFGDMWFLASMPWATIRTGISTEKNSPPAKHPKARNPKEKT